MGAAVGWGALAASSLIIGAVLGLAGRWPERLVGLVLAFGAGALISAIAFELALEGATIGDPGVMAIGLAAGALTYYVCAGLLSRRSGKASEEPTPAGPALAHDRGGRDPRGGPARDWSWPRVRLRRQHRLAQRPLRLGAVGGAVR